MSDAWRCFHCDEVFTDHESAAEHFGSGNYEGDTPVCIEAATTDLQTLVKTNRELWTAQQKSEDRLEQAEFENGCWKQVARSLTGKAEASWHDVGEAGRALIQRSKDELAASNELLAEIIRGVLEDSPTLLREIFQHYDPQLISPEEYLASLENRK